MSVSGCTSCQAGGAEALKAYDHRYQTQLDENARQQQKPAAALTPASNQYTNQPIAGAQIGSRINISA